MKEKEVRNLLKKLDKRFDSANPGEKIRSFVNWCVKTGTEELVLRLTSENKGGWSNNTLLNFTTERIIIQKKPFFRNFLDIGYVAGLAPLPYLVVQNKVRESLEKKGKDFAEYIHVDFLPRPHDIILPYDEIGELFLRKGRETMVINMMGRMIRSNFLRITTTTDKQYDFKLPVNKNGYFDSVKYWISVALPLTVKTSE